MYVVEMIDNSEFRSCRIVGVFKSQAVAKTFWPHFEALAGTSELLLKKTDLEHFPVFILNVPRSGERGSYHALLTYGGLVKQVDMLISSKCAKFSLGVAVVDNDWALDYEYHPLTSPYFETTVFVESIIETGVPTETQLVIEKYGQRDDLAGLNSIVDQNSSFRKLTPSELAYLIRVYKLRIESRLPPFRYCPESYQPDEALQMIGKLKGAFQLELPKQRGLLHLRQFECSLKNHQRIDSDELACAINYFNQLPLGSHKDEDSNCKQFEAVLDAIEEGFYCDKTAVESWQIMKNACWSQLVKFPCSYYWVKYLECITRSVIRVVNADDYFVAISLKIREQQELEIKNLSKANEIFEGSGKEYLRYLSELRELAFSLRPYDANCDSTSLNLLKLITERVLEGKLDTLTEDDEYLVAKAYKYLWIETKNVEVGKKAAQLFNDLAEKANVDSKYIYRSMQFEVVDKFIDSSTSDENKQSFRDQMLLDCMRLIEEPCSNGDIVSDLIDRFEALYLVAEQGNSDCLAAIENLLDKHDAVLANLPHAVAYGTRLRLSLINGNFTDAMRYLLLSLIRYRSCGDKVTKPLLKRHCDKLGGTALLELYESASRFIEANSYRLTQRQAESRQTLEAHGVDELLALWEQKKLQILEQPVSAW